MPRFRLFGFPKPKAISFELTLEAAGPPPHKSRVPFVASGETSFFSRENGHFTFDVPEGQAAYLLQPRNTRGFRSPQKTFISLPAAGRLVAGVEGEQDVTGCTLYIFVCDQAGMPLVRKALTLGEEDQTVFTRPDGAAKAFIAIRLVGRGRLETLSLSLAGESGARPVKHVVEPSFVSAVGLLAERGKDDLCLEYVDRVSSGLGPTGRARYIGAAANEAARAKRFDLEGAYLERLHSLNESPSLREKIARARYRDADYTGMAEIIARWPDVLQTQENSPFHGAVQEIHAAAALAETVTKTHAERYAGRKASPRAAYLLHNSLPYASGGYATRAHGLMRGLLASGGSGVVLARPGFPSDTKPDSGAPEGRSMRRIDGVTYRFENDFSRKGLLYRYMTRAGGYFAEVAAPNVTVIQAASNFYTGLAGAYAAAHRRLPFIYEVRGFWELTRESRDAAFADTPLYQRNRRLEQSCAHLADHILTLTPSMKREIESWGVPAERVTLAPNATDPDVFTPMPRDARLAARLGLEPGHLVIGYAGTFVDYEGLDMLVEASLRLMSRDSRVRLLIVGDDTPGGKASLPVGETLRAQVAASGYGDRVIFTGRVPHDEVPAHYSLMDICPFPRRPVPVCEMVSPMKPLEAMAMGKCVIVSSVGGMEGMVRNGETGLIFKKGDAGALHAALKKAADPELRARLGANARDWIVRERTWKAVGASVAALHAAVLAGEAGFRHHPKAHAQAIRRFSRAFPMLPVIEAVKTLQTAETTGVSGSGREQD